MPTRKNIAVVAALASPALAVPQSGNPNSFSSTVLGPFTGPDPTTHVTPFIPLTTGTQSVLPIGSATSLPGSLTSQFASYISGVGSDLSSFWATETYLPTECSSVVQITSGGVFVPTSLPAQCESALSSGVVSLASALYVGVADTAFPCTAWPTAAPPQWSSAWPSGVPTQWESHWPQACPTSAGATATGTTVVVSTITGPSGSVITSSMTDLVAEAEVTSGGSSNTTSSSGSSSKSGSGASTSGASGSGSSSASSASSAGGAAQTNVPVTAAGMLLGAFAGLVGVL